MFNALLERPTRIPPTGAGAASVTVPCVLRPPVMVLGEIVSEESVGGGSAFTVNGAVAVRPWYIAEIVTVRPPLTRDVSMGNPLKLSPLGMVINGGTRALVT